MKKPITVVALLWPLASFIGVVGAETIWTGPLTTFDKSDFADWTLSENQDRLTDSVWITRANSQGVFNIAQETFFTHNSSPAGTEWADGAAADWQSLSFTDWDAWAGGSPPSTVGRDAVLHLIEDDVYLDITFLAWTPMAGGGGFSYQRSTLLGDLNGDNALTEADVNPFVEALTDRSSYDLRGYDVDADLAGDVNGDGAFNLGDVGAFKSLLASSATGTAQSVPEPSVLLLTMAAVAPLLLLYRGSRGFIGAH